MRKKRGGEAGKTRGEAVRSGTQCAAFLLILVFCMMADGIADAYGIALFSAAGAAVLGTAAALVWLSDRAEQ